jgi:glycerophosphoryl diester phosphodiesterase
MMFAFLPRPAIIAHRGASLYAPENTLAAFTLAVSQGAHAIELDAKLSSDGQVVVIHDQRVDRTTPASGSVSSLNLAHLKSLDAGSFYDVKFHSERIPSLEDVFKAVGDAIPINIELTNYASPNDELPAEVAALVRDYELESHIFFSSFNPLALWKIRKLLPTVPVALLALSGWKGALARSRCAYWLKPHALQPAHQDLTEKLIEEAHRRGVRVHVYTVNEADEMRNLLKMGVDGIFTDDPPLGLEIISEILP